MSTICWEQQRLNVNRVRELHHFDFDYKGIFFSSTIKVDFFPKISRFWQRRLGSL
jgi:hypothetical protein